MLVSCSRSSSFILAGGIVLGYGAGAVLGESGGWRGVYESALPFEALMLIGAFIVPESPRWLALRGRPEEAVKALQTSQGLAVREAEVGQWDNIAATDFTGWILR
jgi:MFS family permease